MSSRGVVTYGAWALAILALSQVALIAVQLSRGSVQPVTALLAVAALVLMLAIILASGLPAARRVKRVTAKLRARGDHAITWVAWLDDGYRRELKKLFGTSTRISVMAATGAGIELWLDDGDTPALEVRWKDILAVVSAPVHIGGIAVDGITITIRSSEVLGFRFALGANRRGTRLTASQSQHHALITEVLASWRAATHRAR